MAPGHEENILLLFACLRPNVSYKLLNEDELKRGPQSVSLCSNNFSSSVHSCSSQSSPILSLQQITHRYLCVYTHLPWDKSSNLPLNLNLVPVTQASKSSHEAALINSPGSKPDLHRSGRDWTGLLLTCIEISSSTSILE